MHAYRAVFVNDTRSDRHYGSDAAMAGILSMLSEQAIEPIHFHPVGTPWDQPEFHAAIGRSDLVIINGEGSIHHSNLRARMLADLADVIPRTRLRCGIVLNATLAANKENVYRKLRRFDLVVVRDSGSAIEALQNRLQPFVVPDFVFRHDFGPAPRNRPTGTLFVDSVRAELRDALKAEAQRRAAPYMRFVRGAGVNRDFRSAVDYMRSFQLVVTGRYHAVCFCIAAGIPFLALESNTAKISYLLDDVFGSRSRVIGPERFDQVDVARFRRWTHAEDIALTRFRRATRDRFLLQHGMIAELLKQRALEIEAQPVQQEVAPQ